MGIMQNHANRTYWFLFSIADVLFLSILFVTLYYGSGLLGGGDAGFHVRIGDYILQHWSIPTHDIFTSSPQPVAWSPPVWLADVIYSLLHQVGGLSLIVVFSAVVLAATHALLFLQIRAQGVSLLMAAFFTILGAATSSIHWLARPHILSYLLLVMWYMVLDNYHAGRKDRLWVLPILTVLWVNIHGSFVIGFGLLGLYAIIDWLTQRYGSTEKAAARTRSRKLWLVLAGCVVAALLNPQGFKLLLLPFHTASNKFVIDHIIEWRSPDFHQILGFEIMLLLALVLLSRSVRQLNGLRLVLLLIFMHMALYAARFVPLFVFIATPILAREAQAIWAGLKQEGVIGEISDTSERMGMIDGMTRGHLWSVAGIIVAVILCFAGEIKYDFREQDSPTSAVAFLKEENARGNLFNSDVFGNYIIYVGGVGCELYCDGRDIFGEEKWKDYIEITNIGRGWKDALNRHVISWVIFPTESALTNLLCESDDWALVHSDSVASVLARNAPENQAVIAKFPNVTLAPTSRQGKP